MTCKKDQVHWKISEEGLLEIYFMLVTNDTEDIFCHTCNKYRTQTDCFQSEKDGLIKIRNTSQKQVNQLEPNIEY